MAATVFAEHERRLLALSPPARRAELFFTLWTRKEAVLKAAGHGFTIDPRQVEVGLASSVALPRAGTDQVATPVRWAIQGVSVAPDYAAALAVEGDARWRVRLRSLRDEGT